MVVRIRWKSQKQAIFILHRSFALAFWTCPLFYYLHVPSKQYNNITAVTQQLPFCVEVIIIIDGGRDSSYEIKRFYMDGGCFFFPPEILISFLRRDDGSFTADNRWQFDFLELPPLPSRSMLSIAGLLSARGHNKIPPGSTSYTIDVLQYTILVAKLLVSNTPREWDFRQCFFGINFVFLLLLLHYQFLALPKALLCGLKIV